MQAHCSIRHQHRCLCADTWTAQGGNASVTVATSHAQANCVRRTQVDWLGHRHVNGYACKPAEVPPQTFGCNAEYVDTRAAHCYSSGHVWCSRLAGATACRLDMCWLRSSKTPAPDHGRVQESALEAHARTNSAAISHRCNCCATRVYCDQHTAKHWQLENGFTRQSFVLPIADHKNCKFISNTCGTLPC